MTHSNVVDFPSFQSSGYAQFKTLRDNLRENYTPRDLASVWQRMNKGERSVVLQSAGIQVTHLSASLNEYNVTECAAIRAAIKRMSLFASDLDTEGHFQKGFHPSSELAAKARNALDSGDIESVKHYLAMIESLA